MTTFPPTQTIQNPQAVRLILSSAELVKSEVLPRVCQVLAHELRFKAEASWTLDANAMFKLAVEVKDLIALLNHPATGELLETIRGALAGQPAAA